MVVSNTFLQGDALSMLKTLPDECVQCCVCSPPYFGLRAYLPDGHPDKVLEIGLEETPAQYVAKLVEVFRGVKRVLRSDGVAWVNLGDSYSSGNSGQLVRDSSGGVGGGKVFNSHTQPSSMASHGRPPVKDMKPKNLLGIPWRVAFALQEDDWILRSDVIWHKTNAMPESVKDRPTKAHEYVFLLSKNERYFYDSEAIKEPIAIADRRGNVRIAYDGKGNPDSRAFSGNATWLGQDENGRNKRSVWSLPTQSFPGSHFAVMAPKLAETCILAGSSPGDIVLDPFSGAGTTAYVAMQHGRKYIGIELNPEYIKLAEKRLDSIRGLWEAIV